MYCTKLPPYQHQSCPPQPSSPKPPPLPDISTFPMESTIQIIRTSIHTFLQHYTYFTCVAILALPFSTSILVSSTVLPDFFSFHSGLQSLFDAAGFPPESEFYSILNLKLSQTISCYVLVLPFSLSFLLLSKTFVIRFFFRSNPQYRLKTTLSFSGIFNSILHTQIWNTFLIISANATCFWVLFIAFNCLQKLHIPSLLFTVSGGIVYSIVVANALIICNMSLILSGMELSGGIISILKSCVLIRGRTSTALLLSLPVNMALAGIESLFEFRIIKACSDSGMTKFKPTSIMILEGIFILEGLFIAYLYSIVITIEVIIGCVFFKSCKIAYDQKNVDQEKGMIKEQDEIALVKCLAKDLS